MHIKIGKGFHFPLVGGSTQSIHQSKPIGSVALLGDDYIGLKAKLLVKHGDAVKLGQILFFDKKTQVSYTSPACGQVSQIEFGEKHCLKRLIISINGDQQETFAAYTDQQLENLNATEVKDTLLRSGLWTAFRTRPYSKTPDPDTTPHSIFVTAMDSNPYAVDPAIVLTDYAEDFNRGLRIISRLANVPIFICQSELLNLTIPEIAPFKKIKFSGSHPAGLPGTHIHFIDPVSHEKTVWYIHYQEVIAIGKLFSCGHLWAERIISIAGSALKNPRLIKAPLGAALDELLEAELIENKSITEDHCIMSGSLLSSRQSVRNKNYLSRYHYQATIAKSITQEENQRNKKRWLESFIKRSPHHVNKHAQAMPFIPTDNFERVMPLDILPNPLLKALLHHDLETAIELGALELDEEDLALCSYICPAQLDYETALRTTLNMIEAESA